MKKLLQISILFAMLFVVNAVYADGITVNVETPDDKVTPQCYFNGAMSGNKWVLMKKVDSKHFTLHFPDAAEIGWGYQFSWNASFDDANAAPNGNITDEPLDGVIDVKVHSWKTTPEEFGILVGSETVIQGVRSDFNPEGYSAQWEVLNVYLTEGQKFMMYNITKEASWIGGIEGESGITVVDDSYVIAKTGKYDLYLKLENESDMLYAEPAKELVWRVTGEQMLMGCDWDEKADANKMTEQSDGTYKLVKEKVNLKAKEDGYGYKFAANGEWKIKIPADDSNYKLSIIEDGSYTVTFTLDPSKAEGGAVAERNGDIVYNYTEYTEWQVRSDWNGGEWTTKNMTSKGSGVFTIDEKWGSGVGLNVYSGNNVIKQDWYPAGDVNLTIADGLNVGDNVTVTLTVVNDDTIKLKVLPKSSTAAPLTAAEKPYVLRYRNLIGAVVPADYRGMKLAEMSDGSTVKIQE
ncbi:MAG: hypothetical protein MJ010_03035 [Paludibacteraceae bacterium]|nr:hypothetical protein [Paludibacteraceae bacterium]